MEAASRPTTSLVFLHQLRLACRVWPRRQHRRRLNYYSTQPGWNAVHTLTSVALCSQCPSEATVEILTLYNVPYRLLDVQLRQVTK